MVQGPNDFGWTSLRGLLQALVPALLMNIHIVGMNQMFDVEIDKVAVQHPLCKYALQHMQIMPATLLTACLTWPSQWHTLRLGFPLRIVQ